MGTVMIAETSVQLPQLTGPFLWELFFFSFWLQVETLGYGFLPLPGRSKTLLQDPERNQLQGDQGPCSPLLADGEVILKLEAGYPLPLHPFTQRSPETTCCLQIS